MKTRKQARLYRNYKKAHTAYWNCDLAGTIPSHEEPQWLQLLGQKVRTTINKMFN